MTTELPKCPKCGHTAGGGIYDTPIYFEFEIHRGAIEETGYSYVDYDHSKPRLGPNGRLILFCGASHEGAQKQQKDDAEYCGHEWEAPEGLVLP